MDFENNNLEEQDIDLDSLLADVADLLTEAPEDSREAAPEEMPALEGKADADPEPVEEIPAQEREPLPELQEETLVFSLEEKDQPDVSEEVPEGETKLLPELSEDTQVFAGTQMEEESSEVTAEFTPPPAVSPNVSRAKVRELRRKLVSGPEQRYYALTEQGVGMLQIAAIINLVIVGVCVLVAALIFLDKVPENRLRLVIFSQVLALMCSGLLGCQLMIDSVGNLFKGKITLDFLLTASFFACFADGIYCLMELRIPCCAAFSLEMTMAMWSQIQRRNTELYQMDTLRKAVRLRGIVRTEDFYQGRAALLKREADVDDFMTVYQKSSGPEKLQAVYGIFALLACVGIAIFGGMLHGASFAVQLLATGLLVAVPASFFVSYTRPLSILQHRLHMVGAVICGWQGIKALNKKAYFPLEDTDLFPQGSMKLNGVKFYGSRDPDQVVSYSASLVEASGGGLLPIFRQQLASRNGKELPVMDFRIYEEGGIGGTIGGTPVLLGSIHFLQEQGIHIPEGTMVSQAVYAAIGGELAAVYAMAYAKMRSAAAGLVTLCGYRRLAPMVLSTDFMLTEDFLRAKFEFQSKRLLFPDLETKEALKKIRPIYDSPTLALSTREELVSTAYAVTGARALHTASKIGSVVHLIGGIAGLLTMAALAYLGSTELLTPANVLAYQLVWMVPGLLLTEWTRTV